MISIRSPIGAVALLAVTLAAFATTTDARHDHHHDADHRDWVGLWNDGKQTNEEAIANCLCWNTTSNNWCHHPLDGSHTGFMRDSCARAIYLNFGWWVAIAVWVLYLVFMPLFFCLFRLCCNCCGGRTPSFGCCCPISNRVLSPDPKWVRPYSRCTTFTAKLLALMVFLGILTVSIHSFIGNHRVSQNLDHTVDGLESMISQINNVMSTTLSTAETYATKADGLLDHHTSLWWKFDVKKAKEKLDRAEDRLDDISHHLGHVHKDSHKFRAQPTYQVVGCVLTLVTLVTLLAACNVRSWPISISAGLLSFLTVLVVLVASVTMTASVGLQVACDHPELLKNLTTGIFTSNGYCGVQSITHEINHTQVAYARFLCSNKYSPVHDKKDFTKSAFCLQERLGGMFTNTTVGMEGLWVVDGAKVRSLAKSNNVVVNGVSLVDTVTFLFGKKDSSSDDQLEIAGNLQSLLVMNHQCNIVADEFHRTFEPLVCGTNMDGHKQLPLSINRLAVLLFALSAIATVAFWVYVHGSKRFTKAATKEELLGHHDAMKQKQQLQAQLYYNQQQMGEQHMNHVAAPAQGVYDDGVNGPAPQVVTTTAAVANTTAEPLLLRHDAPTYGGESQSSVNHRGAADVDELPPKQQPEPL